MQSNRQSCLREEAERNYYLHFTIENTSLMISHDKDSSEFKKGIFIFTIFT